jgi:hypothetical protein
MRGVSFIASSATLNVGCRFIPPQRTRRNTLATFDELLTGARDQLENQTMAEYRFSVVIATEAMTHDGILDATDALGNAGCTDASIRGHADGMELLFDRDADSLQSAIASAVSDVERAGYRVSKVEMERDAIQV